MSYDLHMHRSSGSSPLTEQEVDRVINALPCFAKEAQDTSPAYFYENSATGVYFALSLDLVDDESDPTLGLQSPFLSLNLNYARPTFFALEAMPIAIEIAHALHLDLCDPQGPSGSVLRPNSADELIDSWRRNNEWAVRSLVADGSTPIGAGSVKAQATVEHLTYWWSYARVQPGLEEALKAEDIFTPKLVLVKAECSIKAKRLFCWPDCISSVIPDTELLMIRRETSGPLGIGTRQEQGVVEFEHVKSILGDRFVRRDSPVPHSIYLNRGLSKDIKRAVARIPMVPFAAYEVLPADSVVDVELDG